MSDKGAALDALQTIINTAACYLSSKVTADIIKQSETIRQALNRLPELNIDPDRRVMCVQAGIPEHTILATIAKRWYDVRDQDCAACGACI
jgi:hypothetical protein